MSKLELRWRTRVGDGSRTARRFLDLVVDGVSLLEQLSAHDDVSTLGCWTEEFEQEAVRQLLAQTPGDSPTGRVLMYVCGECGDLGCGAITAVVERASEKVRWSSFAREYSYETGPHDFVSYSAVGPFEFEAVEYTDLLQSVARARRG